MCAGDFRAMNRPRPACAGRASPRKKGWNGRFIAAGRIGWPAFATQSSNMPPPGATLTRLGWQTSPCVRALPSRLENSWAICARSQLANERRLSVASIRRSGVAVCSPSITCEMTGAISLVWRFSVMASPRRPRAKSSTLLIRSAMRDTLVRIGARPVLAFP